MARTWVFIDANIYLELFKTNAPVLKKHAKLFVEHRDRVFVTQQLVDEVTRNKVLVAVEFLSEQLASIGLPKGKLPNVAMELTPTVGALAKSVEKLKRSAEEEAKEFLGQLSRSEDDVSRVLDPLFKKARPASKATVESARSRKEVGNPPGKQTDPLGDQISWEQLLEVLTQGDTVVIASNDSDYSLGFGAASHLSAFLQSELTEKIGPAGTTIVCRTLKDLVQQIKKLLGDKKTKISPAESREAAEVERSPMRFIHTSFDSLPGGLPVGFHPAWRSDRYQSATGLYQPTGVLLGWGLPDDLPQVGQDMDVEVIQPTEGAPGKPVPKPPMKDAPKK